MYRSYIQWPWLNPTRETLRIPVLQSLFHVLQEPNIGSYPGRKSGLLKFLLTHLGNFKKLNSPFALERYFQDSNMFQSEQEQNPTQMVMSTDSNMHLLLSQVHEPLLSPPLGRAPSTFSLCLKSSQSPYQPEVHRRILHDILLEEYQFPTSRLTESECSRNQNSEICPSKYSQLR